MNMDEHEEREERIQALTEKVEKLDRIVYRLWKDLKAIVNRVVVDALVDLSKGDNAGSQPIRC
jgi:archaellum component FlaC